MPDVHTCFSQFCSELFFDQTSPIFKQIYIIKTDFDCFAKDLIERPFCEWQYILQLIRNITMAFWAPITSNGQKILPLELKWDSFQISRQTFCQLFMTSGQKLWLGLTKWSRWAYFQTHVRRLHSLTKLHENWTENAASKEGKRCFNPFPNKPCILRVCSTSLLKTLWEKEQLLVTSNFSFSRSVFYLFREVFPHFHQSKKFIIQERVNNWTYLTYFQIPLKHIQPKYSEQLFLTIGLKLGPPERTQSFFMIWHGNLDFYLTRPIFEFFWNILKTKNSDLTSGVMH